MAPKRPLSILLLLLLSLSALFIFSLYNSSLPPPPLPHPSSSSFTHHPLPSPPPTFSFTIKLLAYNRLASLSRCLRSLSAAQYSGDTVNLHIFIDHFNTSDPDPRSLDRKLEDSRRILNFVDGFSWGFGEKMVHYRTINVGLQAQWLEAWWPSSDDEFAFVVEDDLEVSPLYYRFLKGLIRNYYYNESNFSPWIYGASLQRPRFVPGKHGNKMKLGDENILFLYQLVGTWGQLLFPKPWKEFRIWYDVHKAKGIKPYLDGMVTTGWYKKMGEKIWTPWFIKFIHSRGYFNMYTSFVHEGALSVSHRDAGVNYGKTVGPDSNLLDESCLEMLNILDMQPLSNLKWYDFCFKEVVPGTVLSKVDEVAHLLSSVQKEKPVLLVRISRTSEAVTRNLLCQLGSMNWRNYILVGSRSDLLLDLARRGHPTVDASQLLEDIKSYSSLSIQISSMEHIKDMVVTAYIVSRCLESGFDSWVVNSNMVMVSNDPQLDFVDGAHDFYVSKASGFFYARSTPSAVKTWDYNFFLEFAKTVGSLAENVLLKDHQTSFTTVVSKVLEKQAEEPKSIDEFTGSIFQLESWNITKQSIRDTKRMAFWSSEIGLDVLVKSLDELGLWMVDEDSSCRGVVCHPSS